MSKVKVKCDNCGENIGRCPSKIKKHNFCNNKCRGQWRSREIRNEKHSQWKGGKIKIKCDLCSATIERHPSLIKAHNFCTTKCYGEWRSREFRGEKSNGYNGGKIKIKCDNCGKVIEKAHSAIKKAKYHFCDKKCKGEWESKDKEWGERLKKARKSRKKPAHQTKPELVFEEMCKKNNLPFKYTGDGSFWIGKKPSVNPDFIEANGKKIVVEIFGDYWHSPLRRYCKIRHSQTYGGKKKILKRYGWKLIIFWEIDILREDAEQFVLKKLKREKII